MMFVKIRDKLFQRWLRKVQKKLPINCKKAVHNIAERIDRVAMQNLTGSLGTSHTGIRWGHSQDISIRDSKVITDKSTPTRAVVRLEYTSPHAWVVEHGGIGKVTSSDKPFPIGKSNFGQPVAFRQAFRIQRGYHFLENAVDNPEIQQYIDRETLKAIKKSTRLFF
jgi:hypothetical protein